MATERLVIDASAAVRATLTSGWNALGDHQILAPSLIWSEAAAAMRQLHYRAEISLEQAKSALESLRQDKITIVDSSELMLEAFDLARELGWAKTYDAEFVVLARRLDAPLLTVDARLAATARRIIRVLP